VLSSEKKKKKKKRTSSSRYDIILPVKIFVVPSNGFF
jgi:hypothetical protein